MNNLTLTHNTVFAAYGIIGVSGMVNGTKMTGFVMKDNVVAAAATASAASSAAGSSKGSRS
jgi:hypothetical protein